MDHKTCVKRHIWKFWIWWPFLTWPWPWPGLNMKQFHSSVPSPGPWEYIWKVLGETCYVWGHYGLQPENTRFWPLTWPWPDTWPQFWIFESFLEASRRDLSNAASSVSLRPSVFEIAGGGGRIRPPPPGCGGYRNSPGGGGLKVVCLSTGIGNMELWARGWRIYFSMLPSRLQRPRVVWDCIYSYRSLGEGQRPTQSIQSDEVTTHMPIVFALPLVWTSTSIHHHITVYIMVLQGWREGNFTQPPRSRPAAKWAVPGAAARDVPTLSPIDSELTHISIDVRALVGLERYFVRYATKCIFLNLPFPSNPMENSSIRCILITPDQNLPRRVNWGDRLYPN